MSALFKLGQTVITRNALAFCEQHNISPMQYIQQHANGLWGELDQQDIQANIDAIAYDGRILSCYRIEGEKFYCVTEWDRSVTTFLLASDY